MKKNNVNEWFFKCEYDELLDYFPIIYDSPQLKLVCSTICRDF